MFQIYDSDTEEPQLDTSTFYARRRHYSKLNKGKKIDTDKNVELSLSEQRNNWSNLEIHFEAIIKKLNLGNIRSTTIKLMKFNIVRGKGILCKSIMKAQLISPDSTHIYATLVSYINHHFPNVAELLLVRCCCLLKDACKNKEEEKYEAPVLFIAHLVQKNVVNEWLVLEILQILIKTPNLQSIELMEKIMKVCGNKLNSSTQTELELKNMFDQLRNISQDEHIDESVQYLARTILLTYRNHFEDEQQFDLVDLHKEYTHFLSLDQNYNPEYELDDFVYDLDFKSTEIVYKNIARDILKLKRKPYYFASYYFDEMADDEYESEAETDMLSLSEIISIPKTICLLINSNLPPPEIALELMKIKLEPGQEIVLCVEYLECCFENCVGYNKVYVDILQSFCELNPSLIGSLETIFMRIVPVIHLGIPNKLINLAKLFARLLSSNTISWNIFSAVHIIHCETTYSRRVYFKAMFNELILHMGRDVLIRRILDPSQRDFFAGLFPLNNLYYYILCLEFFSDIHLSDVIEMFIQSAP